VSEYSKQLREKQKIKRMYGISERQFRNTFERVTTLPGITGHNLLAALESRLDNIVYRMGFAASRKAARQLIRHRHVEVNGKTVDIPSYQVRPGQEVRVREKSREIPAVVTALDQAQRGAPLSWIAVDRETYSGRMLERPTRPNIPIAAQEQLVVEPQGGVTIANPEHHLFTLQENRDINAELYVNKGRGYVESDQHSVDRSLPVDLVRIDAVYNPVRRVNFSVAETRVGQRTDYDRLTLTVETNGTVTPEEAVSYAAALAQTHFQYFAGFGSHVSVAEPGIDEPAGSDGHRLGELLNTSIDDLDLSVRSVNSLKNSNIRTLGDLVRQTESQILGVKNFGKKSLEEIADLLERERLNFGMRFEEDLQGIRVIDWGTPPRAAAVAAPDDEEVIE